MLSVFSLFWTGVKVFVCVCVYTHTNSHTACGVLGCEPRGRDETPEEPEESRRIKSQARFIYLYMCTKDTCIYMLAAG